MDLPVKCDDSEEIEEGEIEPVVVVVDYDPALEYPGHIEVSQYPPQPRTSSSPSPPPAASPPNNKTTVLRLICLKSSVLGRPTQQQQLQQQLQQHQQHQQQQRRQRHVAALDGYAEVSVGRDIATSARIRLKEMAVSKFHASIYWDGARREWGIVDMGSMHGTFVRSVQDPSTSTSSQQQAPRGTRLSEPRKASMPRVLRHLDEITIGGTTFLVHEHLTGRPCSECTLDGEVEIPLFSSSRRASGPNSTPLSSTSSDGLSRKRKYLTDDAGRDVKKSMAKLRSSLLSRHALPNALPSSPNAAYKDRSARRRELHPEPRIPVISSPARTEPHPLPVPIPTPRTPTPPPLPPPPVPSSNIGHKLLLLQGWNPGMTLGEDPDIGLLEPLAVSGNVRRAGLGSSVQTSHNPSQAPENWKEEARHRRWDGIKGM